MKTGFQILAYGLILNHFHLVVETLEANLVAGVWLLLSENCQSTPEVELEDGLTTNFIWRARRRGSQATIILADREKF